MITKTIRSKTALWFLSLIFACNSSLAENKPTALNLPKQTIVLKLPKSERKWKEISREMSQDYSMVERIPADQDVKKWSELIAVQIIKGDHLNKKIMTISEVVDLIKQQISGSYPGTKVSWNVLRKNESDILYEWISHAQHKDFPPQHEISRIFLTNEDGVQRIGFTRQYGEMSEDERMNWIEILEKNVSLESPENAYRMEQSISIAPEATNTMAHNAKDSKPAKKTTQTAADLLLESWTQFHKRNSDNPGAKHLQIAHNTGTFQIKDALQIASQEIRDRIIVFAIGLPVNMPRELCYRSYHYASKKANEQNFQNPIYDEPKKQHFEMYLK